MPDKKPDDLRQVKLFGLSLLQLMGIIVVVCAVAIVVHKIWFE